MESIGNVTVVVPRTSWTFRTLPGETNEQALNRFFHSLINNEANMKKFVRLLLADTYLRKPTVDEECNVEWINTINKIVNFKFFK